MSAYIRHQMIHKFDFWVTFFDELIAISSKCIGFRHASESIFHYHSTLMIYYRVFIGLTWNIGLISVNFPREFSLGSIFPGNQEIFSIAGNDLRLPLELQTTSFNSQMTVSATMNLSDLIRLFNISSTFLILNGISIILQ